MNENAAAVAMIMPTMSRKLPWTNSDSPSLRARLSEPRAVSDRLPAVRGLSSLLLAAGLGLLAAAPAPAQEPPRDPQSR